MSYVRGDGTRASVTTYIALEGSPSTCCLAELVDQRDQHRKVITCECGRRWQCKSVVDPSTGDRTGFEWLELEPDAITNSPSENRSPAASNVPPFVPYDPSVKEPWK